MENKFYLEGKIELHEETADLKAKASKVIELPAEKDKQPDLQYFSAILVSSGENLNHAYFLGSELVAAENTIINKALDVEHSETDIIGHLYQKCFIDKDGKLLDIAELASRETASLDTQDMHIAVAGIIYKNRFPNVAQEVADKKWQAVSMECYYQNYDIKIGNLILDKQEAEALGLASKDDKILGRLAKVIKEGKEIAAGNIARVLRGICFSGCGIVKHPANPASLILETANEKDIISKKEDSVIILDYDKLQTQEDSNNVTLNKIDSIVNIEEARNGNLDDTVGICVNYKRRVEDKEGNVINNDWCTAYEAGCTAFGNDATDPNCLRNQNIRRFAKAAFSKRAKLSADLDRRKELLDGLKAALREADKTQSR
jgi:hypothetical protein